MIPVAAGVLRRADGAVLIAQRPAGKIAAGRWEFPGGKREAGETRYEALCRELQEELGITPRQARPLIRLRHDYRDRQVELDTWLITAWEGQPRGRESQALAWVMPAALGDWDLLEADGPIVAALRLPAELPVTGHFASDEECGDGLDQLLAQGHRLIRLRAPWLEDGDYRRLAASQAPRLAARGAGLLVDRAGIDLSGPGIAGRHLRVADLERFSAAEKLPGRWLLAACHDRAEAQAAVAAGADALLLGSVQATASHPGRAPLGWSGFAELTAGLNRPVFGIGGLEPADLPAAFRAGGQGIAAIRAYWRGGKSSAS